MIGGERPPLLTLHGGPGFPHNAFAPLAQLGDERAVVFYDQLGCGQSDRPDDPSCGASSAPSRRWDLLAAISASAH